MTKLKGFQKVGIRQIEKFGGRALLADEMGLGKTIQSIAWWQRYHPELRPVVIVCPAFLKWNWEREIKIHAKIRAHIAEGRRPPRVTPIAHPHVIIINYDILPKWVKWLRRLNPQLIIVDEAHFIKTRSAIRTKATKRLCRKRSVKHVIMLTGTPIEMRPVELWVPLNILRRKEFQTFWDYAERYCQPRKRYGKWEYKGATRTAELNEKLKSICMIRRLKKDVLKDLPPKTRTVIPVHIKGMNEYEQAKSDLVKWLKRIKFSKKKLKKAERAESLVKFGYLKRLAAKLKLPIVKDWIDNFLETTNEKLIVFAVHRSVIKKLQDTYKDMCVVIHGGTSKDKRREYVKRFNQSKNCRILIGQLKAVGVGWNGTAANNVLFAELGWTPGEHTQAEDRIHRIGQQLKCFCWYIIALGTVEEVLCRGIQAKQAVVDSVLDGKKVTDFDLFDMLTKEMLYGSGRSKKAA